MADKLPDAIARDGRDVYWVEVERSRRNKKRRGRLAHGKGAESALEVVQRVIRPSAFDEKRLRTLLTSRMTKFRELMLSDAATARKALGELLDSDIVFAPVVRDGAKTMAFSGKTKAGAFLAPAFVATELSLLPGQIPNNHIRMASPRGFEPRLPP